jgi:GntR family transcriptional regulator
MVAPGGEVSAGLVGRLEEGVSGPGAGAWLREQRLARGWAKAEMARQLHAALSARTSRVPGVKSITRSIDGWEEGSRYPRDRWRAVICAVLGIAFEDFPAPFAAGISPVVTAGHDAGDVDGDDPSQWAQIARALLEQIASGQLKPGARMPRITDIACETGVSRPTARRAYTYLKDQGAICYRPGTGYCVSGARPDDVVQHDDVPGAGDGRFLDALRLVWGAEYGIGIADGVWRAWRLDGTGELITAPGPGELNAAIREDWMMRAVMALTLAVEQVGAR